MKTGSMRALMKLLMVSVMFVGMIANAQTATWTGGGADDNWSTPANWSPAVVPNGNTYTATVDSASATINVDGAYTINQFLISSNSVSSGSTVSLDGPGALTVDINFGPTVGVTAPGFNNDALGTGTVLEVNCDVIIDNTLNGRSRIDQGSGTNNIVRFGPSCTLTLNSDLQSSDNDGKVEFNCTVLGTKFFNTYSQNNYFGTGYDDSGYAQTIVAAGTSKLTFNGGIVTAGTKLQVNSGNCTLVFNAANVADNLNIRGLANAGFHLVVNASQDSMGWLDVGGKASTIDPAGGTLAFADSSGQGWLAGSVTVSTNFTAGDIRFGTSSNGLTEVQLSQFAAEGETGGAVLDADGFLAFEGPPPVISGDTVVDFNYGTQTSVRPADVESDSGYTWNFSDTIPLYDSGTGQNTTIYGGLITTWTTSAATNYTPDVRLVNGAMWIRMQNADIAPLTFTATTAKGMYIWNKDDFLLGSDGTISAVEGNQLLVQLEYQWGGTTTRLVVKQGGVYYVSETSQTGGGTLLFDPSDPTINWAPINTTDYTVGSYESETFTDIEAVGIFFDVDVSAQMFLTYIDFRARLDVELPLPTEISDVSSLIENGNMIVSWQGTSAGGAAYAVQKSTDLTSGIWSNVTPSIVGVEGMMSSTNSLDEPQAFFRTILVE